jgi:hypothetical protein
MQLKNVIPYVADSVLALLLLLNCVCFIYFCPCVQFSLPPCLAYYVWISNVSAKYFPA